MEWKRQEQQLRDKERELLATLASLEADTSAVGEREVRDHSDDAAIAEGRSESMEERGLLSDTLQKVRDALQRIDAGTYGKCTACGRPIEKARLEAIPWAAYCLEDQEKYDRAAHVQQGGSTL